MRAREFGDCALLHVCASAGEKMNHQRYQGKDQKQMNQEARDMVHDEASDPSKNQQHGNGEPNEPTHKPSSGRSSNMNLKGRSFKPPVAVRRLQGIAVGGVELDLERQKDAARENELCPRFDEPRQ
jgi:hypothetical protein